MTDKNKPLVVFLTVAILGHFAATLVYFAQIFNLPSNNDLAKHVTTVKAALAVDMSVNTVLALVLVAALIRRKTGFDKTDSMANSIVSYTVGTGLVTGAVALVGVLGVVIRPNFYIYILIMEALPMRKQSFFGGRMRTDSDLQSTSTACFRRTFPHSL